jgi:rhamnulokinase
MLGTLNAEGLALEVIHRFPSRSVAVRGTLYWDILYLWQEILTGLQKWRSGSNDLGLDGIGLDTWAVDFALLDESGALLDNPVHNRDARARASSSCKSTRFTNSMPWCWRVRLHSAMPPRF